MSLSNENLSADRKTKRVKVLFVGGFLGAGKSRVLGAIARRLINDGLNVGLVSSGRTGHTVEDVIEGYFGMPIAEMAGGCFSARFSDLVDATDSILDQNPDVLLCEPTGSCADIVATVITPLKQFYGATFQILPFMMVLDPERAYELLISKEVRGISADLLSMYRAQVQEADVLLINKADILTANEINTMEKNAKELYPNTKCLMISAIRGDGIEELVELVMSHKGEAGRVMREIEAVDSKASNSSVGWLQTTVNITATNGYKASELLWMLSEQVKTEMATRDHTVMHLKAVLKSGSRMVGFNLRKFSQSPEIEGDIEGVTIGVLVLHARMSIESGVLGGIIIRTLTKAAASLDAGVEFVKFQSYVPNYPCPRQRICQMMEQI
ncbi:MAG: GTP-binding protein [Armatimonadota bacterium]